MKKLLILILFLMITGCQENKVIIPKQSIRFRVVANSNSFYDQEIKQKVKNEIQNEMIQDLEEIEEIENARIKIKEKIGSYTDLVKNTLDKNNIKTDFKINYGNNYFPEKEYKGVTYQEGEYESLVITLGDGNGDNWWCVLFPPLCLLETEEDNKDEIEYKFFIKEIIDKYF
ncbi:MAG: hypothetical protein E7168_00120 [Firmicutes bacterium]|nr:hypothetical protein [Bacillota bacterium]